MKLQQLVQKIKKANIITGDVEYTSQKWENQFQATVTIHILGGEAYAGELGNTEKEAQQNAALQAFEDVMANFEELDAKFVKGQQMPNLAPKVGEKRKAPSAGVVASTKLASNSKAIAAGMLAPGAGEKLPAGTSGGTVNNAALTNKVELNSLLMKLTRRTLAKGEASYAAEKLLEGGFQGTVKLCCADLPDGWQGLQWAGEICATKQAAEQSAAAQALEQMQNDADLSALAGRAKAKVAKTSSGKGAGKAFKGKKW